MKLHWHLLAVISSIICAALAGQWLSGPVWQVSDERHVQFDRYDAERQEWSVIVGDLEMKHWWQEIRSKRNPDVVRRLQLTLPPLHEFNRSYLGTHITSRRNNCEPIICMDINNPNPNDARLYLGSRSFILDADTGKLLRQFTTKGRVNCSAVSNNRLVFFEPEKICLFDTQNRQERTIPLLPFQNVREVAMSPNGNIAAILFTNNTFCVIDWHEAKLIDPFPDGKEVHSFSFVSDDTILLSCPGQHPLSEHVRYRWDGSKLRQISLGFQVSRFEFSTAILPGENNTIHFLSSSTQDWPTHIRSMFKWLTKLKLPIERWCPKKTIKHWLVIDEQDRVVYEYDKPDSTQHRLSKLLSVEIENQLGKRGAVIRLWNLAPIWPNVLAVGMLVYLLLYVAVRYWREQYNSVNIIHRNDHHASTSLGSTSSRRITEAFQL